MSTKERTFDVVNGPNKGLLFDACKYAYSDRMKSKVIFTVAAGYTTPKDDPGCMYIEMPISDIKIVGIEHEDGSGNSLNLHGNCKADLDPLGKKETVYIPYRFRCWYDTKRREGRITFVW